MDVSTRNKGKEAERKITERQVMRVCVSVETMHRSLSAPCCCCCCCVHLCLILPQLLEERAARVELAPGLLHLRELGIFLRAAGSLVRVEESERAVHCRGEAVRTGGQCVCLGARLFGL